MKLYARASARVRVRVRVNDRAMIFDRVRVKARAEPGLVYLFGTLIWPLSLMDSKGTINT